MDRRSTICLAKCDTTTDRIKNIAVIGINTFGWTFTNRGLTVPADMPYVRLTAPSGEMWEWNQLTQENRIEGKRGGVLSSRHSSAEHCRYLTEN